MPDRFSPPTRYECLVAARTSLDYQISEAVFEGRPTSELVAWRRDILDETRDYEQQMLGLWRLTRSEAQAPQDREKGAPDAC